MVQANFERGRGIPGTADPSGAASGGILRDVQHTISREFRSLQDLLANEVRRRPIASLLAMLGVGFFIGRYRVRPVETVLLAGGTGLLAGMALSARCSGRGDAGGEEAGDGGPKP
jgi:hypothetical protein